MLITQRHRSVPLGGSMSKATIALAILILSACSPAMVWTKPGASQSDFSRDKDNCLQEAQERVSISQLIKLSGASDNEVVTKQELVSSCMKAHGWYLEDQQVGQERAREGKVQQSRLTSNPLRDILEQIDKEVREDCDRQEYQILYAKSACMVGDISLEQLSDKSTISSKEEQLLSRLRERGQERSAKLIAAHRTYGDAQEADIVASLQRREKASERNFLDLYEGKISWGDFNRRRKEIIKAFRDENDRITHEK